MIELDRIRQKVIEAIKLSGMTQTALAKKIGVCHQAIGQYLYQNIMPALDTFANLCAVLTRTLHFQKLFRKCKVLVAIHNTSWTELLLGNLPIIIVLYS